MRSVFITTLVTVGFYFWVPSARAENPRVRLNAEKYTLANGLTVILSEDHNIPLISYHTWYRVGSKDEHEGVTGAAHMLEHMMFKGSKKYSGADFDRILHENGITNNAFTTTDYTGFYQNLPSSKLELMMKIEVDRMRYLNLKPEDLKSELQVVAEERRLRVENNPGGLLHEAFDDMIYTKHPYHWPTIGYMKDIQAYTVEKLREFYDTFYVPNNAVLVLVGDFDSTQAKSLIEKYYGPLPAKTLPERKVIAEDPIVKAKTKSITGAVQAPHVMVGYLSVAAGDPDSYPLDLLSSMLGTGTSSRLYKKVVYEMQEATSVAAYDSTTKDPGTFVLTAGLRSTSGLKKVTDAFQSEIKKLQQKAPTDRELQKVKNQVMKDFVDGLDTADEKAQALAINEIIFGDYKHMFTDLEKYEAVTAQDIKRVANQYLKSNSMVTVVLNPQAGVVK